MSEAMTATQVQAYARRRIRSRSTHAPRQGDAPEFRGAAKEAQGIEAEEWLISGPSETGKTWAALWRLDELLRTTPKAQAAMVRKLRSTMDGTVLVTWRRVIERSGSGAQVYGGEKPQWYDYPNGARLWVGGLDNPDKILSGERDWIYVNQAEELEKDDWETLSTRTTGRGAVTTTPMLFGDCNPSAEDHWVITRRDAGTLVMLESQHEDNPSLYHADGTRTPQGDRTMRRLDGLTGVRKQRLRYGRWVGAEGQYFTELDEDRHLVSYERVPAGWDVWGALDYGFAHPLSFGIFAQDPNGRVYLLGHHTRRHWYIPQHVEAMDGLCGQLGVDKRSLRVVAGHDCWAKGKDEQQTVADKFKEKGYHLEQAVTARVIGARAVGERLGNHECEPPIAPTLFFDKRTKEVFNALARMVHDPHNPEDVLKVNADEDGRGGDDQYDMVRYGVMRARRKLKGTL